MHSKRLTPRSLAVLLTAGALTLVLAGSAAAVIYVYGNGFKSKGSVAELEKSGGGDQCDKRFRKRSKDMTITLEGKRLCGYSPPVFGDTQQPDHVVYAKGQILAKKTPKALRKAAYLAVEVRVGGGDSYELQVRPKGRRFKLLRNPSSAAVSEGGESNAIKPIKDPNALRLEVKGERVRAFVNGRLLAAVEDPNPGQLAGRRVSFGLGSRKDSSRSTVGVFERVRAGVVD
jgi:hypothetical protein